MPADRDGREGIQDRVLAAGSGRCRRPARHEALERTLGRAQLSEVHSYYTRRSKAIVELPAQRHVMITDILEIFCLFSMSGVIGAYGAHGYLIVHKTLHLN